jgi:transposase
LLSRTRGPGRRLKNRRRLARRKDVEVWSLDECHFQQHGTRTRMWVPPRDQRPGAAPRANPQSVACFGAVSVQTGKFVPSLCSKFDARTFAAFLKKLLRHRSPRTRMVVVLDNARYHHAVLLAPLRRQYRRDLTLVFLPPYSPHLAPIERVWKLARRVATHNRYFTTLAELLTTVDSCVDQWTRPNSVLRRVCCII